jgi:hypothetical protein
MGAFDIDIARRHFVVTKIFPIRGDSVVNRLKSMLFFCHESMLRVNSKNDM